MKYTGFVRTTFVSLLIFSIAAAPVAVTAQSVPDLSGPLIRDSAVVTRMGTAIERLEDVRANIDRRTFDIDARLTDLLFDPDEIIAFVTVEIAFEQYIGLLRGAEGTLMAGAGNALDQAVLLAGMLKDAGFDARIQRGTLKKSDAEMLYNTLGTPKSRPETSIELSDLHDIAEVLLDIAPDALPNRDEILDVLAKPWKPESDELYIAAMAEAKALAEDLSDVLDDIRAEQTSDKFLEEITDYFWVEFREAAFGEWTAVHPTMAGFSPEVTPTETLLDEIPTELQHRIAFRVINERAFGGKLEQTEIMPTWEQPAASLHGQAISFTNMPVNPEALLEVIESGSITPIQFFVPVLNGALAPGGQVFDLMGNVAPPEVLGSPAAGVFQTVSEKFGSAVGSLSASGSDGEGVGAPTLVAQWIEIDQIYPGGATRTWRRTIVDLLESQSRESVEVQSIAARGARLTGLLSTFSFSVNTGALSRDFVLDDLLRRAIELFEYLGDAELKSDRILTASSPKPNEDSAQLQLLTFGAFDVLLRSLESHIYRSEPSILGSHTQLRFNQEVNQFGLRIITDIVANTRRAFTKSDERVQFDPETALKIGVWESFAEAITAPHFDGETAWHTASWLSDTRKAGAKSAVAIMSDDLAKATFEIDRLGTEALLERYLANDRILLLPDASGAGRDEYGWWSIDGTSGSVIAMSATGFGSDMTEYLTVFTIVSTTSFVGCTVYGIAKRGRDFDGVYDCLIFGASTGLLAAGSGATLVTGRALGGSVRVGYRNFIDPIMRPVSAIGDVIGWLLAAAFLHVTML